MAFKVALATTINPITKSISINEEEAKIVRYIFKRYLEGNGGSVIGRELEEQGYITPRGKTKWSDTTVLEIIKNCRRRNKWWIFSQRFEKDRKLIK